MEPNDTEAHEKLDQRRKQLSDLWNKHSWCAAGLPPKEEDTYLTVNFRIGSGYWISRTSYDPVLGWTEVEDRETIGSPVYTVILWRHMPDLPKEMKA